MKETITTIVVAVIGAFGGWLGHYTSMRKSSKQLDEERESRKEKTAVNILTKQVEDLTKRVDGLYTVNQELREINARKEYEIAGLVIEKETLVQQNQEYEKQIKDLEQRVIKLEKDLEIAHQD